MNGQLRNLALSITGWMLFVLVNGSSGLGAENQQPNVPFQWRLVWIANPATEAIVSWSTRQTGRSHRVYVRKTGEDRFTTIECQRNGRYGSNQNHTGYSYHHCRLSSLEPATRYQLILDSDGNRSPKFWFLTAPRDDRQIRILFGGDSRTGRQERKKINMLISKLVDLKADIIALAHGGDYIVEGSNVGQWSDWLTDHQLTLSHQGRLLPIIPTRGNHDHGVEFNQVFGFENRDSHNYYGLKLNAQMQWITLNTEISMAGRQQRWLDNVLSLQRPACRWIVVQYHRPAWPAVKEPSGALQHWVPLFEKYDVDLVCEADGHVIKRTVPIRNFKPDLTGVVYIGEGGLGVPQRTPKAGRWFLQPPGMASRGHHVHLITANSERLTSEAILLNGQVGDHWNRRPRLPAVNP